MKQELSAAQVRRLSTIRVDLLIWSTLTWIGYFIPPLIIGWLTKGIFDSLTNEAATRSLWTLVGWLLAVQMSRELIQWVWISLLVIGYGVLMPTETGLGCRRNKV